jgi:hypothetical protein
MVGGKFVCNYDKRTCRVVSAKYIFKIVKKNKEDLGHLISQYAYSGHFNDFVTMLGVGRT